ncbi:transcription factor HES-4-A-like [Limulus polyphemus]|uniref:Transcription factor HES-4-A-like n=1 Tax=Limulus polyphemus TaxID=6850 RepID=A0ABM1C0E6_LIMPO|nr:transcription factor HES-4-A-like [Limulus polyphemus]
MPAERPTSKITDYRKATKPIMEKRRRARINQCLTELKTLILDALNEDPSRHSKLEKADILDMTVRHLQNVQRQQIAAAITADPSVLNKFKAGFNECAAEVSRYINRIDGVENSIRHRLLNHLANCVSSLQNTTPFNMSATAAFPGMNRSLPDIVNHLQPLGVQISTGMLGTLSGNCVPSRPLQNAAVGVDVNNNVPRASGSVSNPSATSANFEKLLGGLHLIPTRLPNGDVAFLLPSRALSSVPSQLLNSLVLDSRTTKPLSFTSSSTTSRNPLSSWDHPVSPVGPQRTASASSSLSCALSPSVSDSGSDVFNDNIMASPKTSSSSFITGTSDHSSLQDSTASTQKTIAAQNISAAISTSAFPSSTRTEIQSTYSKRHLSSSLSMGHSFGHSSRTVPSDALSNFSSQTVVRSRDLTNEYSGRVSSEQDHMNSNVYSSTVGANRGVRHLLPNIHHQPSSSIEEPDEVVWRPW